MVPLPRFGRCAWVPEGVCADADERGPEIPRKNRHLVVAVGTPQDSTSAEREANATTERGSQE